MRYKMLSFRARSAKSKSKSDSSFNFTWLNLVPGFDDIAVFIVEHAELGAALRLVNAF